MPHISIKNLTTYYGGHQILKDINVDIPDGQITVVIGPSGCGKTTLLKSLNRLLDLNEDFKVQGDVLIDNDNIYHAQADLLALRKKVGFLSQRPYPLPMSIYDKIAFGARIHKLSKYEILNQIGLVEKNGLLAQGETDNLFQMDMKKKNVEMDILVECYLRLAGLWDEVKDRLHKPASRLSIGQQQRLALARALAVEPDVVLADEPTSALDPLSSRLIEKQFKILKSSYTIVVVTHILRQARRIADYVIFLYMGELVEHGPADQFFNSPKDGRTRAYIRGEIS